MTLYVFSRYSQDDKIVARLKPTLDKDHVWNLRNNILQLSSFVVMTAALENNRPFFVVIVRVESFRVNLRRALFAAVFLL